MKYIVLVADGMADYPIEQLNGRTPMEVAQTPNMDYIVRYGRLGRVKNVPDKMIPASDVANMSILGYDPKKYYSGRGPLEAVNLGITLGDNDIAFRCNLVTVSNGNMEDYSAGHISSKEAAILINLINEQLGTDKVKFFPGISYRHLLLVKDGLLQNLDKLDCKAPHDILDKPIDKNFPKGEGSAFILDLMQKSRAILEKAEINSVRIDLKENPANMIWLWGQGKKPVLPTFADRYGIAGSVISAVDLLKGLGSVAGLEVINVPGATGYYDTDYLGKARAAIKSLEKKDFVFLHVEAPDEAGHNGDLREKITSIERFDDLVLGTILKQFKNSKTAYRILVLPDHATPVSLRTHVADPVCFGLFGTGIVGRGFLAFNEKEAEKSELYFEHGHELMDYFIKNTDG